MCSKYYSEFDFYRKLLRIIESNKIDICKLRNWSYIAHLIERNLQISILLLSIIRNNFR